MNLADKGRAISANNVIIAENEQKVYDSGYSQAESDMWDAITNNNTRTNYREAFRQWGGEYFRPPFPITLRNDSGTSYMFCGAKVKKFEKGYFDFSKLNPSTYGYDITSYYYMFQSCPNLEEFEDIGMPAGGYYFTWMECTKLKKVEVVRSTAGCTFSNPFKNCYALEELTIDGEIGKTVVFTQNSKLTIDSLKSIINALVDYSGTENEFSYTLTLNSGCLATLEAEGATSPNGNTWVEYIDDKKWNLTT